jgi:type I restriction enzyme, S subunit
MAEQMMQDAAVQAIPADYKQTEVGIIPNSWSIQRLANITTLIIDGTHHTPVYTSHGVPFLRVTDIQGEFDETRFKHISAFEHEQLIKRCHPQNGDLLLSKNGTIGIPRVVDWDWGFSVFVSLALIKLKRECLNVHYLEQFFRSDFLATQLAQRSKQGTVTNLHLEEIREILVPLPPSLKEQTAIANVLSDSDALIGALEQLIAKKQAIKSATMQQLLTGRTRLPAFALRPDGTPKSYKSSELGQIPEDWIVVAMNQLIEKKSKITYGVIQPGKNDPAGVLFVRGGDIFDGVVNVEELRKISPSVSMSYKKTILQGGELIISLVGYPGECAIVPKSLAGANIARQVALVRFSSTEVGLHHFICHFLRSPFGKKILLKETFGSAQQVINLKDVNRLELSIPSSHKEQTAIATILSDMDNELQALTQKLEKARALKQGMMQQLLTGKIRLPLEASA